MATQKYKVKKGDTFSSLAKQTGTTSQQLLQMNKGVFNLSQGQVVKVPPPPIQPFQPSPYNPVANIGGIQYNRPIGPVQPTTPASQPFFPTGGGLPNLPQRQEGLLTPNQYLTPQYSTGTNFPNQYSTQQQFSTQQPVASAGGYGFRGRGETTTRGANLAPVVQATADPFAPTNLPAYTGNPNDPNTAVWKARWDAQARAGDQHQPQPVMTRAQIRNMKQQQKQRKQAKGEGDSGDGGGGGMSPQAEEQMRMNAVNSGLNWRIG